MDEKSLLDISKGMVERYSKRYRESGYNVKTLGWGSINQQRYRFSQTLFGFGADEVNSFLDIGCGFGDYFSFLNEKDVKVSSYTGWDINPDLIGEAKTKWAGSGHLTNFEVRMTQFIPNGEVADIVVMLGVLNLNFHDKVDNYEYTKNFITKAFSLCKKLLIVDFLSIHRSGTHPKEDFVFYHDPKILLDFAFSLSNRVTIKHDYEPIPQKELMLYLYK